MSTDTPDNWRQYATEREDTAQQVIERHRREHESLLRLLAQARTEQGRAYRCIQGMHNALTLGISFAAEAYHAPTIGAAKRFVFENALDGSDYFMGKPVDVLHAALKLPDRGEPITDSRCEYLYWPTGRCDKCGNVHNGKLPGVEPG